MKQYYSVTWQDGSFGHTATILSFGSKAARAKFPAQCLQRVESIDYRRKTGLLSDGCPRVLMSWDSAEPTKYQSEE